MAAAIEDIKRAGVAIDVDAAARDGFAALSDDDRYRLKTQGICAQRQVGVFMLRVRVPGGRTTATQLRTVASLADRYGHASIHVTSRAGLELHHVRIDDVPAVFDGLARAGLTTKGTCGDTVRNVIACAHGDARDGAILPLEPFAVALHERIVARSDATNLSRKMNVALACSPACDAHVATSDVGFVAVPDPDGGAPGFALWGAGGLGAAPHLAIVLAPFVAQEDLVPAYDAVVALGETHADRSARAKAKIKMLVVKLGAERVRELYATEFALARARADAGDRARVASVATATATATHAPATRTVAALVPMGELSTDAARALASAADRYAAGDVFLTTDQNVEFHGVAADDVAAVRAAIAAAGLRVDGRGGIADVLSCVGLEYCPLAVSGSMTMGEEIALAMGARANDPRYADFRVHVSGCPHSCAKHQVADLGLAGATVERDGARVEAFVAYVGGNAHERRLGVAYGKKLPRPLVVPALEALLRLYERKAGTDERFSQTVARLGTAPFFAALDGVVLDEGRTPDVTAGRIVVVGNGMAGARFLEELGARGAGAFAVTVFGDEPGGAYNRIALSSVLGGTRAADAVVTHPPDWYAERGIALRAGVRIADVDRDARVVVDERGDRTPYDALVFATGSAPFVPPVPGLDGADVYAFRTLVDCERIALAARDARRAVVLGGGLLGLEAASGLRALGVAVTVVHAMPTLMERQLDDDGGRALAAKMDALGIAVRAHATTRRVVRDEDGRVRALELADGTHVAADLIVVCCGIVPRTDLARAAGIACERGIVVDDTLRTDDPHVYAVGECASHRGIAYGLVEPLWEQCRALAERLTGGNTRYAGSAVGTRLKVAGVNVVSYGRLAQGPGDETVVAFGADGSYRKAIARDGRLVGAQVVGDATAAANLARAFAADAPLPGSLAGLVFGSSATRPPATAATAPEAADRVCHCNAVDAPAIFAAIAGGAHDVAEIGRITLAGTGCGGCKPDLALFLDASAIAS